MFYAKTLPEEELKAILEKLESEDKTDAKRQAQYTREAMLATDEERDKLWKEYLDPESKMSHLLMACSMSGFFAAFVPYETKLKYWDQFWDVIIDQFNRPGRTYSKNWWLIAKPELKDTALQVEKVSQLLDKSESYDAFWKKQVLSDLE